MEALGGDSSRHSVAASCRSGVT